MENIFILGDIAFNGIISSEPEQNPERYRDIIPILADASLVFANLEVPVKADETRNEYKNTIYYSLQKPTEDILKMLNISCVSLANNHIYDNKTPGLKATINMLDQLGIYHTGAGWLRDHIEPVIIIKDKMKIAFLAYVDISTNPKTEKFPELLINYLDIEKVIQEVMNLRDDNDLVILSLHWGVDYSFYPTPKQRQMARTLIDAGVDIIMGHHSHTLQPYEKYKEKYIYYSLGGLTFGDSIKSGNDNLQALFVKTKKGLIVAIDKLRNSHTYISTEEKKGNYIVLKKKADFNRWTNQKWINYKIKHHNIYFYKIYLLKERYIDRIIEYFFGYYKNPFKRLFQLKNLKKLKKL